MFPRVDASVGIAKPTHPKWAGAAESSVKISRCMGLGVLVGGRPNDLGDFGNDDVA
jgi:hypothetical protein